MLFGKIYDAVLRWSKHRHAPYYLGALSFAESSFFPVPPDVMLAPMSLARPERALWFASLTTAASVAGGVLGYLIGAFALDLIYPWIVEFGYEPGFQRATEWFGEWGFLAVLVAGFSPIPYKVFTITAGALGMVFLPFVLASIMGRGARFYLVALLIAWGGPKVEASLRRNIEIAGWASVVLAVAAYLAYRWLG